MSRILIALQAVDCWPRWLRLLALLMFFIPFLPFLNQMARWSSLPVPGERELKVLPQMVGAAVYLIIMLPVIMAGLKKQPPESRARRVFLGVALPVFLIVMSWQSGAAGWPFLDALIRGRPVEATYVVREVTLGGSAKCRNSVRFVGLPIPWDRLCRVSPDVLRELQPGMSVTVTGRGTRSWLITSGDLRLP